mmetsp:Transcript_1897/g.6762  ORF Transcript_1897/g.6762 Transcript_1897/m.6762 type:complete len:149 (+) Transcript_1897:102-548(+)
MASSMTITGMAGSVLPQKVAKSSSKATLSTPFLGAKSAKFAVKALPRTVAVKATATSAAFDRSWLNKDIGVLGMSVAGWVIPSSTPPFFLTQKLMGSIGENLGNFPTGPAIDDSFWLYLVLWHTGLFATMTLGQIGWQGRKQGYFPRE